MELDDAKQAVAVVEEWERRRKADPLLGFEPHRRQGDFIASVLGVAKYENWLIAANRAGKSDAGAYCGAMLARFGLPEAETKYVGAAGSQIAVKSRATSGWVSALDHPTSRDVIQPKYFDNGFLPGGRSHEPFIPQREIEEWRQSDQVLKLKNGSLIGFKSAESGSSKYQGAEKDWVHFDEAHPKNVVDETSIRIGVRRLRLFHTCTLLPPEGDAGNISWVFEAVIRPWQRGELQGVGLFGASIYDNPHLKQEEIALLEARYPPETVAGRIRLGGEWLPGITGTRAYPSFVQAIHAREVPEIIPRRPLAWFWDFNVAPLVSGVGQFQNGVFRIYREFFLEEGSIPEMCEVFRQFYPNHRSEVVVFGDATGRGRTAQSRQSNYTVILNHMKGYPVPIRLRVPESNPPIAERINAVNMACRDEFGASHIEIDAKRCPELVRDLEEVLLDKTGRIKKVTNPRDHYFMRSHISDAFGYWVAAERPVVFSRREDVRAFSGIRRPGYNFGQQP